MEEKENMTAERSLEIITEQIEQSRRAISKTTGYSLYISGLCIMCTAVAVAVVNVITASQGIIGIGHLLWFLLPVVIWQRSRKYAAEHAPAPVSFVGSMIAKTWITFGFFGIGIFIIAIVWSFFAPRLLEPDVYAILQIRVAPAVVLLMGLAVSITGQILKQGWLTAFGIVAGLGCFVWEHFNLGRKILMGFGMPGDPTAHAIGASLPCLTVFLFALVGLMLPGLMLKKQRL